MLVVSALALLPILRAWLVHLDALTVGSANRLAGRTGAPDRGNVLPVLDSVVQSSLDFRADSHCTSHYTCSKVLFHHVWDTY